jgi:hypothetical protein
LFIHDPVEVVRVSPCWAVPDTTGNAVFDGGLAPTVEV